MPRRNKENYTPFGVVLDEFLAKKGMTQTDLARLIEEKGFKRGHPRVAISSAMNQGEQITFHLCEAIVVALGLNRQQEDRLYYAARETKKQFPEGKH